MLDTFLTVFSGGIALGLIWGILAIGVYLSYRILDFADLTVDGSLATGGLVTAVLIANNVNPLLAMLIACLSGMLAGLITGLLHTKLKVPPILAGILTMSALFSINFKITSDRSNVSFFNKETLNGLMGKLLNLSAIDDKNVLSIISGIIVCAIVLALLYWFFGTEFGCAVRATGFNQTMAKAQGINTDSAKIVCLMISNALAALSGCLFAQHNFSASVTMGSGTIVIGLASIILGETLIRDKYPFWLKLTFIVLGSVAYRLIYAIAVQLGMNTNDLKLIAALIIIIVIAVPRIKKLLSRNLRKEVKKC